MPKSVVSVVIPGGLHASDGDEWLYFQGHCSQGGELSHLKKRILRPMPISEDGAPLTLRQILDWAHAESLRARRSKANIRTYLKIVYRRGNSFGISPAP